MCNQLKISILAFNLKLLSRFYTNTRNIIPLRIQIVDTVAVANNGYTSKANSTETLLFIRLAIIQMQFLMLYIKFDQRSKTDSNSTIIMFVNNFICYDLT